MCVHRKYAIIKHGEPIEASERTRKHETQFTEMMSSGFHSSFFLSLALSWFLEAAIHFYEFHLRRKFLEFKFEIYLWMEWLELKWHIRLSTSRYFRASSWLMSAVCNHSESVFRLRSETSLLISLMETNEKLQPSVKFHK